MSVTNYMAAPSVGGRRVIGPIPPRDKSGRLQIPPVPGKVAVPRCDKDGNVLLDAFGNKLWAEQDGDARDPREYLIYEPGMQPTESSIKGLHLYQIDLYPEPLARVYARDEAHALEVYKREFGIRRFGEEEPKVSRVA